MVFDLFADGRHIVVDAVVTSVYRNFAFIRRCRDPEIRRQEGRRPQVSYGQLLLASQ
jgi:hypothetical protein